MTRILNRTTQVAIDLALLSLALWIAFYTRFDWNPPSLYFKRIAILWPYVVALQYLTLMGFGVHRFSWRYIGLHEVTRILVATLIAAVVFLGIRLVAIEIQPHFRPATYVLLPLGINLIDLGLAFLLVVGARVLRRILGERSQARSHSSEAGRARPTILLGAGQAGVLVAKELGHRPELQMKPIAFLDDDPVKTGLVIHGIPVLGTTAEIAAICERTNAEQLLITIANASGKDIRRLSSLCHGVGLPTKIIPGIYEIVGGKVNLSRIRELDIEDLLGREPVNLDESAISKEIAGRTVLVSGAGGSIGAELCRQVCRFHPAALIMVEQAETPLFDIHRELAAAFPEVRLVPCIADVCDQARIEALFAEHRPQIVFHAAAHKHVPMMEFNPGEAIKNNVGGTRVLADVADQSGVDAFVMISTDKAVNPSSIMGVSKRVAELYTQALSRQSKTRFVTVRFGNVLGSAGSVVPIFKEQIARGGPVTVTHPDMKRYFMTIPEACQLVLQAGAMGRGGEIFILDMGEPVEIVGLARDLIRLSGLEPEDIDIEFLGLRPGEKLFEELSVSEENATKTRHPKIFVGKGQGDDLSGLDASLAALLACADTADLDTIQARFAAMVPEYQPREALPTEGKDAPALAVPESTKTDSMMSNQESVPTTALAKGPAC